MEKSTIMSEYRQLIPSIFRDFQNLVAKAPLTHLQLQVIDTLAASNTPLAVKTLRSYVQISRQQLNAVINTLQAAGYLTRLANPDDGRSTLIALTAAGNELNQTRWATVAKRTDQRLEQLTDEQRLELYYCLHKLNHLLATMGTNDQA